jgi:hypothetical protein
MESVVQNLQYELNKHEMNIRLRNDELNRVRRANQNRDPRLNNLAEALHPNRDPRLDNLAEAMRQGRRHGY